MAPCWPSNSGHDPDTDLGFIAEELNTDTGTYPGNSTH